MDALTGLILRLSVSVASICDNREYALAIGRAINYRESCKNLLIKKGANGEGMGRAIAIVIGGPQESLDALPHSIRLVLKRRKSFIKLAIRTGADYVCVCSFASVYIYIYIYIFFFFFFLTYFCPWLVLLPGSP